MALLGLHTAMRRSGVVGRDCIYCKHVAAALMRGPWAIHVCLAATKQHCCIVTNAANCSHLSAELAYAKWPPACIDVRQQSSSSCYAFGPNAVPLILTSSVQSLVFGVEIISISGLVTVLGPAGAVSEVRAALQSCAQCVWHSHTLCLKLQTHFYWSGVPVHGVVFVL